jgi:sodium/potassium-transporting ATPase subunit alpha
MLLFKGAPERIIAKCSSVLKDGRDQPLTKELIEELDDINENLAKRGERVLAFAQLSLGS